jgi:hypothetical protein
VKKLRLIAKIWQLPAICARARIGKLRTSLLELEPDHSSESIPKCLKTTFFERFLETAIGAAAASGGKVPLYRHWSGLQQMSALSPKCLTLHIARMSGYLGQQRISEQAY